MKNSIKIDSVFLRFGEIEVLRGIYLEFKRNKITGILGRNGSGKSCLLKIITGQLNPQSKHIRYNDEQLINLYKKKQLVNYLPQHEFHPRSIKVKSLLNYYGIQVDSFIKGYPFVKKMLYERFSKLSGGERRLIEILLVLESKTKFTILDEPFSHIMPIHIGLIKKRIRELKSEKGILLTDHKYQNVLEVSDSMYLMKDGVIKKIDGERDLDNYGYIREKK